MKGLLQELLASRKEKEMSDKDAVYFMKEAHRLEVENAKLKDKLREWMTEADRDKRHLGMIHLSQETEELLGGGIK